MSREILVVKREVLFGDKYFQGFMPLAEHDYTKPIYEHGEYKERDPMETDESYQQPIPYIWIVNPKTKQVFLYRRSLEREKEGYKETRHKDKWSGGVGGHIDKDTEVNVDDCIKEAMMRELQEEVKMETYPTPQIRGYLNDDEDEIGKFHFGLVAIAETEVPVTKADDSDEMAHAQFYSIEEVEEIFANEENKVETWTSISWPHVKEYLQSLPNE